MPSALLSFNRKKAMNRKQLLEFRGEVDKVIEERKALGDFDANSKYMVFLLSNMRDLIDHAISTYPKAKKSGGMIERF